MSDSKLETEEKILRVQTEANNIEHEARTKEERLNRGSHSVNDEIEVNN